MFPLPTLRPLLLQPSHPTVARLVARLGRHCLPFHTRLIRNLAIARSSNPNSDARTRERWSAALRHFQDPGLVECMLIPSHPAQRRSSGLSPGLRARAGYGTDRSPRHVLRTAPHRRKPDLPGQSDRPAPASRRRQSPSRNDRAQQAPTGGDRASGGFRRLAQLHQTTPGARISRNSGNGLGNRVRPDGMEL